VSIHLKDNKIDYMSQKVGMMITEIHNIHQDGEWANMENIEKGLKQLLYDLELLRKCTLDNPDFKWDDNTSHGYTEDKVKAFKNEI
jgi:hypothetical protein